MRAVSFSQTRKKSKPSDARRRASSITTRASSDLRNEKYFPRTRRPSTPFLSPRAIFIRKNAAPEFPPRSVKNQARSIFICVSARLHGGIIFVAGEISSRSWEPRPSCFSIDFTARSFCAAVFAGEFRNLMRKKRPERRTVDRDRSVVDYRCVFPLCISQWSVGHENPSGPTPVPLSFFQARGYSTTS